MNVQIVTLHAKETWFFSRLDEAAFFEWLNKLTCIAKYEGIGDTLYIEIDRTMLNQELLREIIALFYRYRIDMKQLAFLNEKKFSKWFRNEKMYWYKDVFINEDS